MLSLLFIIIGHTSYGITNTLWKNPREKIGTLPLILFRSFSCFLIFFFAHFLSVKFNFLPAKSLTNIDIYKTIGICAINYFGLFFYLKSLKHAQVSNTIGFSKMGLILGIGFGYFVYHERIGFEKILVCLIIILAVYLIEKSTISEKQKISKGLVYSTLSRLFWSSAFLFVPFIEKLGALFFCSILEFTVFGMTLILLIFSRQKFNFKLKTIDSKTKNEMLLLVLLGTIGTFCLNFAIAHTSIIIFAFLGLIEPIVGLIISKIYHKDKINKLQFIGLSLGLVASFVLTFF